MMFAAILVLGIILLGNVVSPTPLCQWMQDHAANLTNRTFANRLDAVALLTNNTNHLIENCNFEAFCELQPALPDVTWNMTMANGSKSPAGYRRRVPLLLATARREGLANVTIHVRNTTGCFVLMLVKYSLENVSILVEHSNITTPLSPNYDALILGSVHLADTWFHSVSFRFLDSKITVPGSVVLLFLVSLDTITFEMRRCVVVFDRTSPSGLDGELQLLFLSSMPSNHSNIVMPHFANVDVVVDSCVITAAPLASRQAALDALLPVGDAMMPTASITSYYPYNMNIIKLQSQPSAGHVVAGNVSIVCTNITEVTILALQHGYFIMLDCPGFDNTTVIVSSVTVAVTHGGALQLKSTSRSAALFWVANVTMMNSTITITDVAMTSDIIVGPFAPPWLSASTSDVGFYNNLQSRFASTGDVDGGGEGLTSKYSSTFVSMVMLGKTEGLSLTVVRCVFGVNATRGMFVQRTSQGAAIKTFMAQYDVGVSLVTLSRTFSHNNVTILLRDVVMSDVVVSRVPISLRAWSTDTWLGDVPTVLFLLSSAVLQLPIRSSTITVTLTNAHIRSSHRASSVGNQGRGVVAPSVTVVSLQALVAMSDATSTVLFAWTAMNPLAKTLTSEVLPIPSCEFLRLYLTDSSLTIIPTAGDNNSASLLSQSQAVGSLVVLSVDLTKQCQVVVRGCHMHSAPPLSATFPNVVSSVLCSLVSFSIAVGSSVTVADSGGFSTLLAAVRIVQLPYQDFWVTVCISPSAVSVSNVSFAPSPASSVVAGRVAAGKVQLMHCDPSASLAWWDTEAVLRLDSNTVDMSMPLSVPPRCGDDAATPFFSQEFMQRFLSLPEVAAGPSRVPDALVSLVCCSALESICAANGTQSMKRRSQLMARHIFLGNATLLDRSGALSSRAGAIRLAECSATHTIPPVVATGRRHPSVMSALGKVAAATQALSLFHPTGAFAVQRFTALARRSHCGESDGEGDLPGETSIGSFFPPLRVDEDATAGSVLFGQMTRNGIAFWVCCPAVCGALVVSVCTWLRVVRKRRSDDYSLRAVVAEFGFPSTAANAFVIPMVQPQVSTCVALLLLSTSLGVAGAAVAWCVVVLIVCGLGPVSYIVWVTTVGFAAVPVESPDAQVRVKRRSSGEQNSLSDRTRLERIAGVALQYSVVFSNRLDALVPQRWKEYLFHSAHEWVDVDRTASRSLLSFVKCHGELFNVCRPFRQWWSLWDAAMNGVVFGVLDGLALFNDVNPRNGSCAAIATGVKGAYAAVTAVCAVGGLLFAPFQTRWDNAVHNVNQCVALVLAVMTLSMPDDSDAVGVLALVMNTLTLVLAALAAVKCVAWWIQCASRMLSNPSGVALFLDAAASKRSVYPGSGRLRIHRNGNLWTTAGSCRKGHRPEVSRSGNEPPEALDALIRMICKRNPSYRSPK